MGDQADYIFASLTLTKEESKTYDIVRGKYEAYFVVKKNVFYEIATISVTNSCNTLLEWHGNHMQAIN